MKVKLLAYIFTILLLASFTSALEFSSLKINSDIQKDYEYTDMIYTITNNEEKCINQFNISIPYDSKIIYLRDEFDNLDYEKKNKTLLIYLGDCVPFEKERLFFIKIKTKSVNEISKKLNKYVFEFVPLENIFEYTHKVKLPNTILINSVISVSPKTNYSLRNNRVVYSWEINNLSQRNIEIIEYKVESYQNLKVVFIMIIILLVSMSIFGYFILMKKRKSSIINKVISALNEKEKIIIKEIIKNPGIIQYQLKNKTQMTKSNISKILSKLEFRELVLKKNEGKINRLYPGNKLKKL